MTTLKQINELLQGELTYFYGFPIGELYYNGLENENTTYESFSLSFNDRGETSRIYLKHLSGYLFTVELNGYESVRALNVSPALFEHLRQFSIKSLVKKQISTYEGLIRDTQERINQLAESLAYYNKEHNKSVELLERLDSTNEKEAGKNDK